MASRISPQGGTLLGFGRFSVERTNSVYYARPNPNRFGAGKSLLGASITHNGAAGSPVSSDYTADRSVPEIADLRQMTRNGPFGSPLPFKGQPGAFITEQRDTLFTINAAGRAGDAVFSEQIDDISAHGLTGGTTPFSNKWFNATWFSDLWFNSTWFNTVSEVTGNADAQEAHDTTTTDGRVFVAGDADITEQPDQLDAYGSSGNDAEGEAQILEDRDSLSATGKVITTASANILEANDEVSATGGLSSVSVRLTWVTAGTMVGIDIYRSDDGITYTKIGSTSGTATTYVDPIPDLSKDYYYYIVGTQTTGAATEPSEIAFMDLPNN